MGRKTTGKQKTRSKRTYPDGQPFDELQYLQSKLLLKPDRFGAADRFREFGKIVARTARSMKIDVIDDTGSRASPRVREVIFVDTPDFRLYRNRFILRRRIRYVDGFPTGDPEIVFKFRYPNIARAAAMDVRPKIPGKYRIKFKLQALPLNDHLGGYRLLYSHNCQFGISQVHQGDRTAMKTLTRIFPALAAMKTARDERVRLVNEAVVEELLLPLGRLDFGKGIVAKSDIALWRTRGDHRPIVGEYSFQVKFDRRDDVPERAQQLIRQFFITVQHQAGDWISLGTTKTGLVYRLSGHAIERHE
jgi:hypothetical protein